MVQRTIDRLHYLRLKKVAEAYLEQKNRGGCGDLTFDERFLLLVEAKWLARMERRVKRRLKLAKLKQRAACLKDVDYSSRRGLDRKVIEDLATCHWVRNGRNVIITGATGVGRPGLPALSHIGPVEKA